MRVYSFAMQSGIALLISATFFHTPSLPAQQCSNATTVGRWVVVCDGYLTPGATAPLTPAKELGTAVADEDGVYTGSGTVSVGGAILQVTVKGTQTINSDCTGTITYQQTINGQPGPDFHDTFVVSEHGNKINGLAIDPGSIFACTLSRLRHPEDR